MMRSIVCDRTYLSSLSIGSKRKKKENRRSGKGSVG